MRAPTLEELSRLEAALGFVFPPSYLGLIQKLPASLLGSFPRARFVVATVDLREVHRARVPASLMPFLIDPQPHHDDYYCFDQLTPAPEYGIAVFASHATVAQWASLADWLTWVDEHAA